MSARWSWTVAIVISLSPTSARSEEILGFGTRPATYLVLELTEAGEAVPVFARDVLLRGTTAAVSPSDFENATSRYQDHLLPIELVDESGVAVERQLVRRDQLRGLLRASGACLGAPGREYVAVRIPRLESGTLHVVSEKPSSIDLQRLRSDPSVYVSSSSPVPEIRIAEAQGSGDPANRVDLLIVSEGFRTDQQGLFSSKADSLAAEFFAVSPYSRYRNYFNIQKLFVPSQQAGADHPPYSPTCSPTDLGCCSDVVASSDPKAGTFVDTAFGARYCASGVHRLLVVDSAAVLAAASESPDWDYIFVLVNDDTYGGSGGYFSVASTHYLSDEIAIHEFGHSFSVLGDEYETSALPKTCSDQPGSSAPTCKPNITDLTSRDAIKWSPWISASTPIPTPESPAYASVVGLFEGAYYTTTGLFRPKLDCRMRSIAVEFCEVCKQEFVRVLYGGNRGVPVDGIDPIEPGSETPSPGAVHADLSGTTLSAQVLQPNLGPSHQVSWWLDGVQVPGAMSTEFMFVPPGEGAFDLELRVEDRTTLVHPEMTNGLLTSSRSWAVTVGDYLCTPSPARACLLGGRFAAEVEWRTPDSSGLGEVMEFGGERAASDQSAFFTFFDPANFEMGVKMVDACTFNDSFWIFASGLTNVEYALTITDLETSQTRQVLNELGNYPQSVGLTDGVSGFECGGAGSSRKQGSPARRSPPTQTLAGGAAGLAGIPVSAAGTVVDSCIDDATHACHLSGRFRVQVDWNTVDASGSAQVMDFSGERASSDQSSFWWFFDPSNFEMGVKMVDACVEPFNAFWVFVSGLTNQAYDVEVTDTVTGAVRHYLNPLGAYPRTIGATDVDRGFPCF